MMRGSGKMPEPMPVRTMRFKAAALLLAAAMLLCLLSCGELKETADEGEILSAAERLISESVLWNELFFIDGLPVLEGGRESGNYREVDPAYLAGIGMSSLSEILEYGRTIYSADMMETMEATLFGSIRTDDGTIFSSAACFDFSEGSGEEETFLCLMVNPSECPRFGGDTVTYRYDGMTVTYNLNRCATVLVTAEGSGENAGKTAQVRVNLVLEETKWKLDNYTFVSLGD